MPGAAGCPTLLRVLCEEGGVLTLASETLASDVRLPTLESAPLSRANFINLPHDSFRPLHGSGNQRVGPRTPLRPSEQVIRRLQVPGHQNSRHNRQHPLSPLIHLYRLHLSPFIRLGDLAQCRDRISLDGKRSGNQNKRRAAANIPQPRSASKERTRTWGTRPLFES